MFGNSYCRNSFKRALGLTLKMEIHARVLLISAAPFQHLETYASILLSEKNVV